VDGVVALTHTTGCGMAGDGSEEYAVLRRTLTGYARHPNFAGFLIIGLGCEVNQVASLVEEWDVPAGKPVVPMTIQELGGTRRTIAEGVARIRDMLPAANAVRREPVPASRLVLAMECGGSDGYSGITANPALGAAADLLIRHGGTAVFGETPEIYGAEHLLARRAATPEVGRKLIERIKWWEDYTSRHGGSMDNNPSPGNKAGGLTTILEKSLGAAAKGGTTNLTEVVEFAQPVTGPGLVFMDTPGYDPVNATGLVAGGAHVLCFTTGRGSVFGCKPTPSLKLATNTPLYEKMTDDMDINCGLVADGGCDVAEMGRRVFELVLATASGRRSRSEELGFGDEEFVPWQLGAVM
jgi:altronate hydrolase